MRRRRVKPAALWAVAELADLLAEDGTVDAGKVQEAIRTAEESLGIRLRLDVEREGYQPATYGKPSGRDQWDQAFRPPVAR